MQQLMTVLRREHGATAVLVGILMVPLLGIAAVSVDVGAMYLERAQLQNGADAAALGIAQACARGSAACSAYDAGSRVTKAVDSNDITDSLETLQTPTFPTSHSVKVTTSTLTPSGTALRHPLAAMIGFSQSTEQATATAEWDAANSGTVTLPLAFSLCGLQTALAGGTKQLLRSDQNNPAPGCTNSAGQPIAGGFGWLTQTGCSVTVGIGSLISSDQGNDLPSNCQSLISPTDQIMGKVIEVPVFDCVQNASSPGVCLSSLTGHVQGKGGAPAPQYQYHIYGFAAFKIEGHRLTGSDQNSNPAYTGSLSCTGNCRGLQGVFVDWSFPGSGGGSPGPDLGAYSVKLTN